MIFFIDIDGVFMSHRSNIGNLNIGGRFSHFSPEVVGMINTLGTATNAQIVVTSIQRHDPDIKAKMLESGLTVPLHTDWKLEGDAGEANHGAFIRNWCKQHNIQADQIMIFDDENLGYTDELAARFVRSDGVRNGFSVENFLDAAEKLGLSMPDLTKAQQLMKSKAPARLS